MELTVFEKLGVVLSAGRFVALDSWAVAPESIFLSKATSFLSSANSFVSSIILQLAHTNGLLELTRSLNVAWDRPVHFL